jgi:gluconolactonase
MAANPIDGFTIDRNAITYLGKDLQRPECVLAEPDGSLWSADARGGVMHIRPDGTQALILQSEKTNFGSAVSEEQRFTTGTLPNGLAFARNGNIIVSNFGTDRLELMTRRGDMSVLADRIDSQPIGKVNFVLRDSRGRYWITVSTRTPNWMSAVRPDVADGFVALYTPETGNIRVVAEGFRFTNEIRFDAAEQWLYVVETCGPCITRLKAAPDGTLTDRETFGPADHGALIDGIAFDAYGNLWGTHVMTDRIFALTPEGELRILLDDAPVDASKRLMDAFYKGQATPELMLACGGSIAPWMASLTFFGRDLRQVAIGSLRGTRLPVFTAPVAGLPMEHWGDPMIAA